LQKIDEGLPGARYLKLVQAVERGETSDYVFFWGREPGDTSEVGPFVFSQWYLSDFVVAGVTYPTAEHCMMFNKAALMGDEATKRAILMDAKEGKSPSVAKQYGRLVKNWDQAAWDVHKFGIVVDTSVAKFGQNAALRGYLLSTGDRALVEASPYDKVWGIGMKRDNPRARDPRKWDGENLLGFALMEARDRLRAES